MDSKLKVNRQRSIITYISFSILLFFCCAYSSFAQGFTPSDENGPFQVKQINEYIIKDNDRNRDIPVRIYYPQGKGPFPVLIYSHGLGGSYKTKIYLANFLTSHGFICIHLTHYGSDSSLIDLTKPREEIIKALKKAVTMKTMLDRPKDVSKVLDSLEELETVYAELKGKMDKNNIGLHGHSFGAFTTLLTAGAFQQKAKSLGGPFLDPRPKAFIAMSPQGTRPGVDPKEVYSGITRPFMSMTGSEDNDPIQVGRTPESRTIPYHNMPPGDKYLVWIIGGHHSTFGDPRPTQTKKPDPMHHKYIKILHLAFWNAYLKDSKEAKAFLMDKKIQTLSNNQVEFSYR
jgi:predicted dienelactone hydrolase